MKCLMNSSNSSDPSLNFSSAPHPPLSPTIFPMPAGDSLIVPAAQARDPRSISDPYLPSVPFHPALRMSSSLSLQNTATVHQYHSGVDTTISSRKPRKSVHPHTHMQSICNIKVRFLKTEVRLCHSSAFCLWETLQWPFPHLDACPALGTRREAPFVPSGLFQTSFSHQAYSGLMLTGPSSPNPL